MASESLHGIPGPFIPPMLSGAADQHRPALRALVSRSAVAALNDQFFFGLVLAMKPQVLAGEAHEEEAEKCPAYKGLAFDHFFSAIRAFDAHNDSLVTVDGLGSGFVLVSIAMSSVITTESGPSTPLSRICQPFIWYRGEVVVLHVR